MENYPFIGYSYVNKNILLATKFKILHPGEFFRRKKSNKYLNRSVDMTNTTQTYKQCIVHKNKMKSDLIQISIALGGNLGAFFCFYFFKSFTPAFLVANTFTMLLLLSNVFFRDG